MERTTKNILQARAAQPSVTVDALPHDVSSDNAALQETHEQSTRLKAAPTEPPSAFFRLPRELRDQIYEYCLIVPETLSLPKDAQCPRGCGPDHSHQGLTVSLLSVNRQIREEAPAVLFGKNTWQFTMAMIEANKPKNGLPWGATGPADMSMCCFPRVQKTSLFLTKYSHLFRSVVVTWRHYGSHGDIGLIAGWYSDCNRSSLRTREDKRTALYNVLVLTKEFYTGVLSEMSSLRKIVIESESLRPHRPGFEIHRKHVLEDVVEKILKNPKMVGQLEVKVSESFTGDERSLLTRWRRQKLGGGKVLFFVTFPGLVDARGLGQSFTLDGLDL